MIKKWLALALCTLSLLACSGKNKDDLAPYRQKSQIQIFNDAEKSMAKGNWSEAAKGFEALDAIYPFGSYTEQGQLDQIYAYYKNGDGDEVIDSADRYINLHPLAPHVDYAYYMKGLAEYEAGLTWLQRKWGSSPAPRDMTEKKQAFLAFEQIVRLYPQSPYAKDAALHMAYIRNMLAEQQLLIADYYMQRKAYVAAADRAAFVVAHFNGSPQVIPALVLMVKAYRKLGLMTLASNTMNVLKTNYPNAVEAKGL